MINCDIFCDNCDIFVIFVSFSLNANLHQRWRQTHFYWPSSRPSYDKFCRCEIVCDVNMCLMMKGTKNIVELWGDVNLFVQINRIRRVGQVGQMEDAGKLYCRYV